MVGIYKVTSPSGKIYIGQSWYIPKRLNMYKNGYAKGQIALLHSLNKYGPSNHKFEIIHVLPKDVSQNILDTYEVLYWELYKDCGVKMLNVREPGRGGKPSKESVEKMAASMRGKKHSEETKRKIGLGNKGSTWRIGWKNTPEANEKVRIAMTGRKFSAETILKMKASQKGKIMPKGYKATDKAKENLKAALKIYYKTHTIHNKIDRGNVDELVNDYVQNILTIAQMIAKHKISGVTITKIIKEKNIPFRENRTFKQNSSYLFNSAKFN